MRRAIAHAHRASIGPRARAFHAAAADPALAQRAILRRILREQAGSAYAREHRIVDEASFRRAPISDAETMRPWWRRIEQGESSVTTAHEVLMMERSGGTTGATKLVPYTRALLDEIGAATSPWLRDLYDRFPALRGGSSYWSVSPPAHGPARTSGGVPIGFADDAEYFGPLARWGLRQLFAVPSEVARIRDVNAWRSRTADHLRAARDLRLISVWSPTFLSLLLDEIGEDPRSLWPDLALVSCWMDGPSARFAQPLQARLPHVAFQGKGLLATEGVVSFPLVGARAPVLAVASHYLEFIDLDREGPPIPAHALRPGGRYSPLLTTSGGSWRYHLKDVVTCVGHHLATPLVRFEGRVDHVSDLVGEKVSVGQAERATAGLRFALLAPSLEGGPHYRLYYEGDEDSKSVAARVESALRVQHPYEHARRLGQLGPLVAIRVRDGERSRERVLVRDGQSAGSVKPMALDARPRWDDAFEEGR